MEKENSKEKFFDILAQTYSEGYEAGLRAGLYNSSTILKKVAETMENGVGFSFDKAKEAAYENFHKLAKSFGLNKDKDKDEDESKVIDINSAKKSDR